MFIRTNQNNYGKTILVFAVFILVLNTFKIIKINESTKEYSQKINHLWKKIRESSRIRVYYKPRLPSMQC